ncbi:MAG: dihydropteroate synthase [Armatimonadetes bacterium]|nr:dihydropteroate synthase [Armatimonadota bacterium]
MIVIGERINGMFKAVNQAIQDKDKAAIQDLAKRQIDEGADMLDINVGTAAADPVGAMKWLVETVREVTDVPLSIDNPNLPTMKAGLEACTGRKMINSTIGSEEALNTFFPLAKEHNAMVVCLCIDDKGVPVDVDGRVEIAMRVLAKAMEYEIPMDDIYIDPIVLPVKADQTGPGKVLESIRQFGMLSDPKPHIVIGLSNLSQGAVDRKLINRTFLTMAIAQGLDAAILDPLDTELMDAMITAEMLMNRTIYSDSFLKAYRQR